MKKMHIIGIIIVSVALTIILSTAGDASSYVTFAEAIKMAREGNKKKIHVVGTLKKDDRGNFTGIEPSPDRLAVAFTMVDNNSEERKVFYNEPMPPDLLKSEQVVVIGSFRDETFVADKILLKCPSKYQEEKLN
jgi:cytochrome c-type biogenesis protein CcmE